MTFPSPSFARRKRLYLSLDIEQLLATEAIDSNKLMPRHPDPNHPQTIEQGHDPLFPIYLPLKVSPTSMGGPVVGGGGAGPQLRGQTGRGTPRKSQGNCITGDPWGLKYPRLGEARSQDAWDADSLLLPWEPGQPVCLLLPHPTLRYQEAVQVDCGVCTGLPDQLWAHQDGETRRGGGHHCSPFGASLGTLGPVRRKREDSLPCLSPRTLPLHGPKYLLPGGPCGEAELNPCAHCPIKGGLSTTLNRHRFQVWVGCSGKSKGHLCPQV